MRFGGLVLILGTLAVLRECHGGATEQQMMKAAKLMRDVCQPKFKVSDELVDGIKEGKFPDNKDLKCYANCVLEMMQSMRRGKFNYESSMKQIDLMLPDDYKEPFRNGVNACKDSADDINNACDASWTVLQCFYNKSPKMFSFMNFIEWS